MTACNYAGSTECSVERPFDPAGPARHGPRLQANGRFKPLGELKGALGACEASLSISGVNRFIYQTGAPCHL